LTRGEEARRRLRKRAKRKVNNERAQKN